MFADAKANAIALTSNASARMDCDCGQRDTAPQTTEKIATMAG
jgi:hypothetical protein